MSDFNENPFGFSRARNRESLGILGDPERWGGFAEFQVPLEELTGERYVYGPQIIRVQFADLRGRAVDVLAQYEVLGQTGGTGDWIMTPWGFTGFGIELAVGAGQASTTVKASPVYGVPVNPWSSTRNRTTGFPESGVMQILFPFPGVSLNIRPIFGPVAAPGGPATLTVRSTILVSPRNLKS